jgi:D-arabinose 1-dehydrogenase-like Zn-dependent alcohol dehydrogenase
MNTISNLPTTLKNTAQAAIANMTPLPKTYKAAAFEKANAPLTPKDVPLKEPSAGELLVKGIATGVCHSDAGVQSRAFGSSFPIIPGHEIIGNIAAIGDGKRWKVGDRVSGP